MCWCVLLAQMMLAGILASARAREFRMMPSNITAKQAPFDAEHDPSTVTISQIHEQESQVSIPLSFVAFSEGPFVVFLYLVAQ